MNDLLSVKKDSPIEKVKKLIELQAILKDIKPQIEVLKAELLAITQQSDVYILKTGDYTISRAKRITPQVVNFKQLKQSLDEADIPYMTEEVFTEQMTLVFKITFVTKSVVVWILAAPLDWKDNVTEIDVTPTGISKGTPFEPL